MEQIRNKNYQSAEHYGLECQLNQLQEECGELIQAVNKFRRSQGNGQPTPMTIKEAFHLLVEEMVDVYICLEMLKKMFNYSSDEIARAVEIKLDRFERRNEKHE